MALLVLLLIFLGAGLGFLLTRLNSERNAYSRESPTEDALLHAKAALIGYAASYREQVSSTDTLGYLPCPDTNNDGVADTPCGAAGTTAVGRLPWKTLGLPDLRSADGECFWYVVSGTHKSNPKTAPLNWDARGSIRLRDIAGNVLVDGTAAGDATGGAVAAVIAPGAPLPGQNRGTGGAVCSGIVGNDIASFLEGGYPATTAGLLDLTVGDPSSAANNDRVVPITAAELFAPLARRNDLLATVLTDLQSCLNAQATLPLPATPANYTDNGGGDPKWQVAAAGIEEIIFPPPGLCTWPTFSLNYKLWTNWKDHIRYVRCKNGPACLNVGAANCTGALLFGGRNVNGFPRTAAEKNTNGYFEDPNRTTLNSLSGAAFSSIASYSGAAPSQDLALCLTAPTGAPLLSFSSPTTTVSNTIAGSPLATMSGGTLTLGAAGVDSGDAAFAELFACAWVGGAIPMGNGLRAYFRYNIDRPGPGFAFAVIDSSKNPMAPNVCGGGGRFLGYAGTPSGGGVSAIAPPKLALEIDTEVTLADRNDVRGGFNNENHLAAVFWGARANADDDNAHNTAATAPDPANASLDASSYSNVKLRDNGKDRDVRIELHAISYNAGTGITTFQIRAWVVFTEDGAMPAGFDDTTVDFAPAPQYIHNFTVGDFTPGVRALDSVRVGFTGSVGVSDQVVDITNFKANSR